jgi:hypothetical protein
MFGNSKFGVGVLKHPGYNGKGGDAPAPAPTNQTVTQTNLPEYARPYFENLLNRTQAESYRKYTPYAAQRIAGFDPAQVTAQNQTLGLQTSGAYDQATDLGMGAAQQGLAGALGNTQDYMSPYIQGALNPQVAELQRQGELQRQNAYLGAMKRGTYGGSRNALMQSEILRNTQRNIGDTLGKGYQTAYEQALSRQRDLGQLGLSGLTAGTAAAREKQAADLERLTAQSAVGTQKQAQSQQKLDTAYQDFLRQRDYPLEQLGFYSNVLRGLPVQLASTTQSYAAPTNSTAELAGLGLAGLGAYNKATGK